MKKEVYTYPRSSFLSVEKDLNLITGKILQNENLKKLLYYNSKDCLSKPKLTPEESAKLFGKYIKLVPKLTVDGETLTYLIISLDNFTRSANSEFRDNIIEFDIICHFDQWQIDDLKLRPYRIAAELDSMFDKQHLTGIGEIEFLGANQIVLTDEFAGLCLMYQTWHGEEDKKFAPNPKDEANLIENFNAIYNTKNEEQWI